MLRRASCALLSLIAVAVLPSRLIAADIYAGDAPSYKDGPVAGFSWTGFHFGVHVGYGWGDSSIKDGGTILGQPAKDGPPPYGAFACGPALSGNYCGTPFELSPEGGLAGVQLGYSVQRGNLVFGVEGELGWLNLDDEDLLFRPFDDQDFASVEYGMYGTLALRVGLAFDRALLYAKGGLAFADIETVAFDLDNGVPYEPSRIESSGVRTGWALGGGVEYALSDTISVKAEYLYMDFGTETTRSFHGDIYDQDHSVHTAKIGLNLRLSPREADPLK